MRRWILLSVTLILAIALVTHGAVEMGDRRLEIPIQSPISNLQSQVSITGELVETYCWGTRQIGGPGHAACGIECAKRGIPVAVVDTDSRKVFVLLTSNHNEPLPAKLIAAMGNRVTIRGEIFARGGTQFITVASWSRAR